jgi:glyoxylase-like metal-dependent hydrolase (beta-lactamase superfamily II)
MKSDEEDGMPWKKIAADTYELSMGAVNIWLVEGPAGLTLIDTGYPARESAVLAALAQLGRRPAEIHHILLTHGHPDHAGSLAALKAACGTPASAAPACGAEAWAHALDAQVVTGRRELAVGRVSPGLFNTILFNLVIRSSPAAYPRTAVEHEIAGDALLAAGGIRAIHTPGHTAGHLAYLTPGGALLIGDACSNVVGLDYSIIYEDMDAGRRSLAKLAREKPEAVGFSHGKALRGSAVAKFQAKWAAAA